MIPDTNLLFVVFQTVGFSAGCIALALCVMQRRFDPAYTMLGLTFLVLATSELSMMFEITVPKPAQTLLDALRMLAYVSTLLNAPFFLFYVRHLKGPKSAGDHARSGDILPCPDARCCWQPVSWPCLRSRGPRFSRMRH